MMFRTGLIIALFSLMISGAGASGCGTSAEQAAQRNKQSNNRNNASTPTPGVRETEDSKIKVLSQGGYSMVRESFVAVARDAQTYIQLRRLDDNLPPLDAGWFQQSAVIAAFLGQRRSGGYGVKITRVADGALRITESKPPEGSLTTQALTTPYQIVSVPLENEQTLRLDLDDTWRGSMQPYRISEGEFTMSGGFASRSEKLSLEGGIQVIRYGALATLVFDIKGKGGTKGRELKETTTGTVRDNGEVTLARFNAGSLVEPPVNLLGAKGQFTNNGSNLSLALESLPSTVADGYQGSGRLTAAATGPLPPKRASNMEEAR